MFQWLRNAVGGGELARAKARLTNAQAALYTARTDAIKARYDNALTTDENRRNWWMVDYMSAKAANNFQVRRQLRLRSRYEVGNNPYLFGVCNNNADDLVCTGPTLQLLTDDAGYNRAVEESWRQWCAEVGWVEKLRTIKLAKTVDGEGFLILKTVRDLEHPVKLYPVDVEADQVTTPAPANLNEFWVDGLVLHPVTGRPIAYHVLKHHPGDYYFPDFNPLAVEKLSKRYVIHWFQKWRPGQVRGVPIFTPSLDLFSELRSFRKAVLNNAQLAAQFTVLLESEIPAGLDNDVNVTPFAAANIDRGMQVALPSGMKASQLDPKQPGTSYEMFQEKCLGEACRPLSYPLNLALGTSQKFNFSSAKLDHINYRSGLTVERADCDATVSDQIFAAWFEEAVLSGAIPVSRGLNLPSHVWHWPGFESLDPVVDASADHDRLAAGTDTRRDFWARRGRDWKDMFEQQAEEQREEQRLGLEFGDPVKRNVTESVDDPDKKDDVPAAKSYRIRAVKDDNGQEHDEEGKFGSGGAHHDRWKKEDRETEKTRDKEDRAEGRAHDKEESAHNAAHEKQIDTHDKKWEQHGKATDRARDKEDTDVSRSRDKEDDSTRRARDKEDAETDKARQKSDHDSDKWDEDDEKRTSKRDTEDESTGDKRHQENESREARRKKEDEEADKRRNNEEAEIHKQHETNISDLEDRYSDRSSGTESRRDKEDYETYHRRRGENPDAHQSYYPKSDHEAFGDKKSESRRARSRICAGVS